LQFISVQTKLNKTTRYQFGSVQFSSFPSLFTRLNGNYCTVR